MVGTEFVESSARVDAVRRGVEAWNRTLDYTGSRLVTVEPAGSGPNLVVIRWEDLGEDETYGFANCRGGLAPEIVLNTSIKDDLPLVEATARQEMGHILGLDHTGDEESFGDDNPPGMATCLSVEEFYSQRYAQDDAGALTSDFSQLGGEDDILQANPGFEQGFRPYWGVTSGSYAVLTDNPASGKAYLSYMSVAGDTSNSYAYQSMNYAASGGETMKSVVNTKRADPNGRGWIYLDLYVRQVTYGEVVSNCVRNNYETGKDQNVRDFQAWQLVASGKWYPSTRWEGPLATDGFQVPGDWHGADARVAVRTNLEYGDHTTPEPAHLDNVRVQSR